MENGKEKLGLANRDQVRKENMMEHALYPKGEGKPFKTTIYTINNIKVYCRAQGI